MQADAGLSFGARLRRLRQAAGLTQEELAERAELTAGAVGALERGERQRPYPHTIRSLASALGLSDAERAALVAAVLRRTSVAVVPTMAAIPNDANRLATSMEAGAPSPTEALAPSTTVPGSDAAVSAPTLLTTKLFAPPVRGPMLARPRLIERLAAGLRGPLTLVAAPAGFGKTTLLAQWQASSAGDGWAVAWVALDAADNDPTRFWSYIITALDRARPGTGIGALALLRQPQPVPIETVLTTLINRLSAEPGKLALILDDVHVLTAPAITTGLAFLLDHRPPALHLVLLSRSDPALPLARLRARGQLTEVRATDLRCTPAEVSAFLNDVMRLALNADDVTGLAERTEGWLAGLQLAALALREQATDTPFIAEFTGSHRFVLDYLTDEVLTRQPVPVRDFLLRTSPLDRLCGPLCDAMTGTGGGQAMLETLEVTNLFVVPLDAHRGWYRYHHLFVEALRHRLARAEPALPPVLHRRAAIWLAAAGLDGEAIRHALAAEDVSLAADLIERASLTAIRSGELATARDWLMALPEAERRTRPRLCLDQAHLLLFAGNFEQVEAWSIAAEHALDQIGRPSAGINEMLLRAEAAVVRAYPRLSRDPTGARQLALAALPHVPAGHFLHGMISYVVAMAALADDAPAEAERALREAARLAESSGNGVGALGPLTQLARVCARRGNLSEVVAICRHALALAGAAAGGDPDRLPVTASFYLHLGSVAYLRDDLEAAEAYLRQAMALGERGKLWLYVPYGAALLARVRQARGDRTETLALLTRADYLIGAHQLEAVLSTELRLAAIGAWLRLLSGEAATIDDWVARQDTASGEPVDPAHHLDDLALALASIHLGESGPALATLDRLAAAATAAGRNGHLIDILIVQALAQQTTGDMAEALATLTRALALAEPEKIARPFLDHGAPITALLRQLTNQPDRVPAPTADRPRIVAYAGWLLGRGSDPERPATPTAPGLIETLTGRERAVLRLLTEGKANKEIASELCMATGTVKVHLKSIFGKLDVTNRTEATTRAHALGLLAEKYATTPSPRP